MSPYEYMITEFKIFNLKFELSFGFYNLDFASILTPLSLFCST